MRGGAVYLPSRSYLLRPSCKVSAYWQVRSRKKNGVFFSKMSKISLKLVEIKVSLNWVENKKF